MTSYLTADGTVRITSKRVRGAWHRQTNRRGGVSVLWSAYHMTEQRWLAQELFTLRALKTHLASVGVDASHLTRA